MSFLEIPLKNKTDRRIIHIDMDAFYASIEERDDPALKKKALIIARDPRFTDGTGVVTTANYNARKYGVHSAMSAHQAAQLVPKDEVVFKAPDFNKYRQISAQIHDIFYAVTEKVESVALDEVYLDVTDQKTNLTTIELADQIQSKIWDTTHLMCSVGISYNKFLAKLASEYRKPKGRTLILPEMAIEFLKRLPIEAFQGVGKKTAPKLNQQGIYTGEDLLYVDQLTLIRLLGKQGYSLYRRVHGIDDRPVVAKRQRKSLGKERTFNPPITTKAVRDRQIRFLSQEVAKNLKKKQLHGSTLVLKLRNSQFETLTKQIPLATPIDEAEQIEHYAQKIMNSIQIDDMEIRLLGVTLTNLSSKNFENIDLPLFRSDQNGNSN